MLRFPVTPVSATAPAAVDGHSDFGWNGQADQTLWTAGPLPQSVTLDLGRPYSGIDTLTYLPRQDTASPWSFETFLTEGNITRYRVSVSVDGAAFRHVASGSWAADHALKSARFRAARARYVRLEALSAVGGATAIASEIGCGGTNSRPRAV